MLNIVDLNSSPFYNLTLVILTMKEVNILANETGKRYSCGECGAEFVVTRGADGTVSCCGEPMSQK